MTKTTRAMPARSRAARAVLAGATLVPVACGVGTNTGADFGSTGTEDGTATTGGSDGADGADGGDATSGDGGGVKYDVGPPDAGGAGGEERPPSCEPTDDGDAVPPCNEKAPPDSFDPEVQWSWDGFEDESDVVATPLVANLTDDNGDGNIDMCDVPDIVILAYPHTPCMCCAFEPPQDCKWEPERREEYGTGHLYVLDGATGELHLRFDMPLDAGFSGAGVADIDGDGIPEIVAARFDGIDPQWIRSFRRLVAFEHDGTVKWEANDRTTLESPIAFADLDNDGSVEIIALGAVWNAQGEHVYGAWDTDKGNRPVEGMFLPQLATAADLDGDGDLELVTGPSAIHHDGTLWFDRAQGLGAAEPLKGKLPGGSPHVADVDGDRLPEIVVFASEETGAMYVLEHDGALKFSYTRAGFDFAPAAIHDVDGDGAPEVMSRTQKSFTVHDFLPNGLVMAWNAPAEDLTGLAGGTAFDFLGDASAEAIYADETQLFVFGERGTVEIAWPRGSWTGYEFPVVADVDNDGSAEIVVVSNGGYNFDGPYNGKIAPAVQVLRDKQDRWVGARRIWNQHTYHVTNVREDGGIPQFEPPHWTRLNTFRTQAQLEGGSVCQPEPEG